MTAVIGDDFSGGSIKHAIFRFMTKILYYFTYAAVALFASGAKR